MRGKMSGLYFKRLRTKLMKFAKNIKADAILDKVIGIGIGLFVAFQRKIPLKGN